ncbi:N-terminal Xaa-Pro-Lys N-methyltransferase 1-B isoform X1 [Bacillus rossius redtenbacheri]|uniref:N-terminal Xaa-Pro-Lys N-methyltransferase 1-B isoform X1 n=1 Tax=Bacillus rossius redtenbacheri TaxID=93214 RepID=UPI002FDD3116
MFGMDNSVETSECQEETFYKHAAKYWSNIPATVDGMLGGFGFISHTDIQGSSKFLQQLFKMKDAPGRGRALDCGAGIGRVTKHLLVPLFDQVDLVEQNPAFLEQAREYVGPCRKLGELYGCGLQDFVPEEGRYDVIWTQWVLGHLTDDHLIQFFKACIGGLRSGGVVVVKENVTSSGRVEVDAEDSSVTRPPALLLELLGRAGLRCLREQRQTGFPAGLYPVKMYALRAAAS